MMLISLSQKPMWSVTNRDILELPPTPEHLLTCPCEYIHTKVHLLVHVHVFALCNTSLHMHIILFPIYSFGLDTVYPITLDNVDCFTSNYLTILQCGYSTNISSSCSHGSDDVSVTCCELLTWIFEFSKDILFFRYDQNLEQPIWWSDTFARLRVL